MLSGVFYGITHRRSLQKAHDEEKKHHAIHEREHLIEQAKEAWRKKQEGSKDGGESSTSLVAQAMPVPIALTVPPAVVTDPEDPRFDLEKLIAKWESESK